MLSKTDILNKALVLVGANTITSIDDDSNNARICKKVYEGALRSILSECKWNFATKRALLSVSADSLAWYDTGEGIVYVKPTDLIKIFDVTPKDAAWREEGDYIISDSSDLGIRYVYYLDNPDKYSASFVDALVDKLCYEIAYRIVNSQPLAERYRQVYEKVSLPKAISSNSQVGIQQVVKDDAWELAKYQDWQPNS